MSGCAGRLRALGFCVITPLGPWGSLCPPKHVLRCDSLSATLLPMTLLPMHVWCGLVGMLPFDRLCRFHRPACCLLRGLCNSSNTV